MQEIQQSMSLDNHLVSLQQKHKDLEKYLKYNKLSDDVSKEIKKKKLKLKDDIEYCQMKINILSKIK